MIIINVKTKFKGMVAFRDKYLKECKLKKEGLEIRCQGEKMIISLEELDKRIKFVRPVPDRYSKEMHQLIYYWWKPEKINEKQTVLF